MMPFSIGAAEFVWPRFLAVAVIEALFLTMAVAEQAV